MPIPAPATFALVRAWLEVAYFGSCIVLAGIAALGLRQLRLTKEQIRTTRELFSTQSTRAALESAANECRRFAEQVLQDSIRIDRFVDEHGISFFDDVVLASTDEGITLEISNVKESDVAKFAELQPVLTSYINGIEVFALYFLAGIADETIAFATAGHTYLTQAERALKIAAFCGLGDTDAGPIAHLYIHWRKLAETRRLESEKAQAEAKLAGRREFPISPIGTS